MSIDLSYKDLAALPSIYKKYGKGSSFNNIAKVEPLNADTSKSDLISPHFRGALKLGPCPDYRGVLSALILGPYKSVLNIALGVPISGMLNRVSL